MQRRGDRRHGMGSASLSEGAIEGLQVAIARAVEQRVKLAVESAVRPLEDRLAGMASVQRTISASVQGIAAQVSKLDKQLQKGDKRASLQDA